MSSRSRGTCLALLPVLVSLASGAVFAEGEGPSARAGAIEGTVTVRVQPPRRSATRYPGEASAAHAIQEIPAVAYLTGVIPGAVSGGVRSPTMVQRDTAFVPAALVVAKGTTVRFPNEDPFFHNVFSYSAVARFDLGRYPRGETKDVTFDEPGVVKVYCEVHEFMRSVVVVTENPHHAIVDDGRFRLEGVPPGTYTLVVWHPDLDPVEQQVQVTDGGTARVRVDLK